MFKIKLRKNNEGAYEIFHDRQIADGPIADIAKGRRRRHGKLHGKAKSSKKGQIQSKETDVSISQMQSNVQLHEEKNDFEDSLLLNDLESELTTNRSSFLIHDGKQCF